MALLVWSAMFPYSTLISYGFNQVPFMAHWPLVARTFCMTCLLVPFMVFAALPFLTRRFREWLQLRSDTPVYTQPKLRSKKNRTTIQALATNGASV